MALTTEGRMKYLFPAREFWTLQGTTWSEEEKGQNTKKKRQGVRKKWKVER